MTSALLFIYSRLLIAGWQSSLWTICSVDCQGWSDQYAKRELNQIANKHTYHFLTKY